MRGIHPGPMNSPHKWPVTRKKFPPDDVIMVFLFVEPRYLGPNRALYKSTWQHSNWNDAYAHLANDGNAAANFYSGSCALTGGKIHHKIILCEIVRFVISKFPVLDHWSRDVEALFQWRNVRKILRSISRLHVALYTYTYLHTSLFSNNTLPAKSMEYFEAQWKHSYLTFSFAVNGLAPTTTKYCRSNAFLMHSVRGEKYKLQCPKLKLHKIIYGDLSFFNTSHKISHSFQGIYHYIVNLWECYVCSVISY